MRNQSEEVGAAAKRATGAELSFDAVYEAELGYVWNTLRRLGVRDAYLEDLTQDVFLVVYRRLAEFDTDRPIRPWLFGISYRIARDFRRKAVHTHEVGPLELREVPSSDQTPEEATAARQDRQLLMAALERVDIDQRAVLVMHDIDGHAMPIIADALGIPLNTAYSRLRLARKAMAKTIAALKAKDGAHD